MKKLSGHFVLYYEEQIELWAGVFLQKYENPSSCAEQYRRPFNYLVSKFLKEEHVQTVPGVTSAEKYLIFKKYHDRRY